MEGAAQPTRLKLPLAGGSKEATVSLKPLMCGEVLTPPGFLVRESDRGGYLRGLRMRVREKEEIWIPVPAYLVEHPKAGPILVDTGLHPSIASDPKKQLGIAARVFTIRMTPEQAAPAQLRKRGIDPASIKTVIMTHLHLDHASAISEFPNATFILGAGEWTAATAPRALIRGYLRRQIEHAVTYTEVNYGGPEVNSYAGFGRSVDLFGDGSVRLCYTPGHTPGHQSVILRIKDRQVLLTGDAAYVTRSYAEGIPPVIVADEHRFRVSAHEIRLFANQNPEALIIPGHDPQVWKSLESAYE